MREVIIARLQEGEEKLRVYDAYRKAPDSPQDVVQVVSFSYLFELMAYAALSKLVPDYTPPRDTQIQVAQGFGGTTDHVSVVDGKVQINPSYYTFKQQVEELKQKRNAQLDQSPR